LANKQNYGIPHFNKKQAKNDMVEKPVSPASKRKDQLAKENTPGLCNFAL
jgi:hypothetical protein